MRKLFAIASASVLAGALVFLLMPAHSAGRYDPMGIPGIPGEEVQNYHVKMPGTSPPNAKPPIMEIGKSIHVIGRIDKEATVHAEVWVTGKPAPEYRVVRLAPGTWLLPDELYLSPNTMVCTDNYCERKTDAE